jgi:lysophospholipase L1-like esterase
LSGKHVLTAMLNRLRTLLTEDTSYDWIIILAGTNDILDNVSAEKIFKEGLRPMYEMCLNHREGKTKLAILTVIEIWLYKPGSASENNRQLLNTMIRDYVTNSNQQDRIRLVDLDKCIPFHSITDNKKRKTIWDDGVHLTPAGYDRMASLVFDVIKKTL